jgi:hypothetical protein
VNHFGADLVECLCQILAQFRLLRHVHVPSAIAGDSIRPSVDPPAP